MSTHTRAVLQALFVTFLWSTSWVFIKIGLEGALPPLTFAGLRYTLAFCCLLPLALRRPDIRVAVRHLRRRDWYRLTLLGLLFYAAAQGAQFVGLSLLPAATVNLLLNFSSLIVTIAGIFLLGEYANRLQWVGMVIMLGGALVYFYPVNLPSEQITGIVVVLCGVFTTAAGSLLGRGINRAQHLPALAVTTISMGIGAFTLLTAGLLTQGLPSLDLKQWGIIGWLALVNTAFAFTLWNHTLRHLTAMESSVINSAMLIQIPIMAWIFLGERIGLQQIAGIALTAAGILLVQLRGLRPRP